MVSAPILMTLAHGIAARPKGLPHVLADDDRARRTRRVLVRDPASANDARPHRREIFRRDGVEVELPAHRVDALDKQALTPRAPERHGGLQARVLDAGNCLGRSEQPLPQLDFLGAVELDAAHLEVDQQNWIDVITPDERPERSRDSERTDRRRPATPPTARLGAGATRFSPANAHRFLRANPP